VRPVNLIPREERRGAARTGADAAPVRIYALLGALGVVLLCVLALVITNNQINGKTEDLAQVKVEEQGVKQVADALRPYGQFAQLQQARQLQISALAESRFDWEHALQQLSRAIPSNAWLLNLTASVSPGIDIDDSGGGGDAANLREKVQAPAFEISGCTYSQHAVARMMTRMQNLDDVTDVQLAKSARKDDADTGGGTAITQAASDQQAAAQEASDCVGSPRITKFDMLIVFGGGAEAAAGAPGADGAPTATAQTAAAAQGAAATAQGGAAPAPAGGTP
jgi:Tfp pilus assembly protein PilN